MNHENLLLNEKVIFIISVDLICIAFTPTADGVAASDRERSRTRERVTPSVPLRDRLLATGRSRTPHWLQRDSHSRQKPLQSGLFPFIFCGSNSPPAPTGHFDTWRAALRSALLLLHTADNAGVIPPGAAGTPRWHYAEGVGPHLR